MINKKKTQTACKANKADDDGGKKEKKEEEYCTQFIQLHSKLKNLPNKQLL